MLSPRSLSPCCHPGGCARVVTPEAVPGVCFQTLTRHPEQIAVLARVCSELSCRDNLGSKGKKKNYTRVLPKKEKKGYKKASKSVLEEFLGTAPSCLSGARQQLTSSDRMGQRWAPSPSVTQPCQPDGSCKVTISELLPPLPALGCPRGAPGHSNYYFLCPASLWRRLLAVRALTPEPQPRKSSNPRPQQSPGTLLTGSRASRRSFGAPNAEDSEGIVPLSLQAERSLCANPALRAAGPQMNKKTPSEASQVFAAEPPGAKGALAIPTIPRAGADRGCLP